METLVFKCETITPMFLSGADGRTPELRPPSIKGAMRFWWRAIHPNLSLEELRKKEGEIFGSTDEKVGRSKFGMRVKGNFDPKKDPLPNLEIHKFFVKVKGKERRQNILEYLAYGPLTWSKEERKNIFFTKYIPVNTNFEINFLMNESESDAIKKVVINTMNLLSNFGGLGSKSRNGFGNFIITSVIMKNNNIENPVHLPLPKVQAINLLKKFNVIPDYTAFSQNAILFRTNSTYTTWDQSLAYIGKSYREAKLSLEDRHIYKKRQYIGSPISDSFLERHSKPYFLKVNKEKGMFRGYILFLPSSYCDGVDKPEDQKQQHNKQSIKVYNEFNKFLAQKMEVISI